MTNLQRRWLHNSLAIAAIICSAVSLFALFELDAPRWISPLNVLAGVLVSFAVITRGNGRSRSDE